MLFLKINIYLKKFKCEFILNILDKYILVYTRVLWPKTKDMRVWPKTNRYSQGYRTKIF